VSHEPQRPLTITRVDARRLAISRQHLAAPRLAADPESLRTVLRSLRYLQLDPVSVVAPSHHLVLWSRLGPGAVPHLDDLLWSEHWLFEYWLLHRVTMNAFPSQAAAAWMHVNDKLRKQILRRLDEEGFLPTGAFDDCAVADWPSSGWTGGRNVERMLQFLWLGGDVMVAGRAAGHRLWGLTKACLPPGTDRRAAPRTEAAATAVEHALHAMGIIREADLKQFFPRTRDTMRAALDKLRKRGIAVPVQLDGAALSSPTWFVHADLLDTLDVIRAGDWAGRTTLLSPFDNLILDRDRVEQLWGFAFRNEMYVPKAKRQYGYYVLPVLHGDQLVGRIAPKVDRRRGILRVEGLYLEPGVSPTTTLCRAVTEQIADLAAFTGAARVEYGDVVPERWRVGLHQS
jgi:hypothetical protein